MRKNMDRQELEATCRICLESSVELYWNDSLHDHSDLTYKECYYKYTQLEYIDPDNFSPWLCRNCSNSLEYIDAFISKAIETHLILQKEFNLNTIIKNDQTNIKYEAPNLEELLIEDTEIKLEVPVPEIQNIYESYTEKFVDLPTGNSRMTPEKCDISLKRTKKIEPGTSTKKKKFEKSCNKLTRDQSPINDNKLSVKIEEKICCSICSKVLSSRYVAIEHEKIHIQNRERNVACDKCGLKFYLKSSLRSHMLTHIENRIKNHKCDFCDKAFYNKGDLNIHRRIHLGQMLSCSLCTKQYCRQIDLDKHMASHSAARITSDIKTKKKCFVPCKDCGENVRSTSFKSHMAKHMNEPLYKCSICNKEFFSRDSCDKHVKKTHKIQSSERRNFIIPYKTNRLTHLFLEQYTSKQA